MVWVWYKITPRFGCLSGRLGPLGYLLHRPQIDLLTWIVHYGYIEGLLLGTSLP